MLTTVCSERNCTTPSGICIPEDMFFDAAEKYFEFVDVIDELNCWDCSHFRYWPSTHTDGFGMAGDPEDYECSDCEFQPWLNGSECPGRDTVMNIDRIWEIAEELYHESEYCEEDE